MNKLTIVVAVNMNMVIGLDNKIPWHLPEDLKHFKTITTGHAIIMGRKTWDSIGRPLPKRRNIVISTNQNLTLPEGVELAHSLLSAIELARQTDDDPCIIGGAQIYATALPLATTVQLTLVFNTEQGDTFFPTLPESEWTCTAIRETDAAHYKTYQRSSIV